MGMISVRNCTSADDVRAAALAAVAMRKRINTPPPKPKPQPIEEAQPVVRLFRFARSWTIQQDSHVTAWRLASYQTRIKSLEMSLRNREEIIQRMVGDGEIPAEPRVSALDVCKATLAECAAIGEGNFSMSEILDHRRGRAITHVRHKCQAAVVLNCRHLSYPQIGRFFDRDHSSIMWAAQKFGVRR